MLGSGEKPVITGFSNDAPRADDVVMGVGTVNGGTGSLARADTTANKSAASARAERVIIRVGFLKGCDVSSIS